MNPVNDGDLNETAPMNATIYKMKHHKLSHKQPGSHFALQCPQDSSITDDLLLKAIAVTLYGTGFSGVQIQALQSFHGHVHEYMRRFSLTIKQSIQSNRRLHPLPIDFIQALSDAGLTASSFKEDIRLSPPVAVTQPPILPATDSQNSVIDLSQVFAYKTAGERSKLRHIPKHFPELPSEHSYKETSTFAKPENDARKVREQAMQQGMLAEEALRKLMAASKASKRSGANKKRKRGAAEGMYEEDIWQETMDSLQSTQRPHLVETRATLDNHVLDGHPNTDESELKIEGI